MDITPENFTEQPVKRLVVIVLTYREQCNGFCNHMECITASVPVATNRVREQDAIVDAVVQAYQGTGRDFDDYAWIVGDIHEGYEDDE